MNTWVTVEASTGERKQIEVSSLKLAWALLAVDGSRLELPRLELIEEKRAWYMAPILATLPGMQASSWGDRPGWVQRDYGLLEKKPSIVAEKWTPRRFVEWCLNNNPYLAEWKRNYWDGVITDSTAECTLLVDPGPLATGRISLEMQNETGTSAGFDVWLIPPGHTFAEMAAHVREERRLAEAGQRGLGHPAFVLTDDPSIRGGPDVGKAFSASGRLDPSEYAVVCLRIFSQVGQLRPHGIAGPLNVH